ncbi:stage II sporulation protein M [Feifania hominis]|uniref:Stage II sporulation protein M n=1 Tax=Feifania hominis TaxID=2763660 RepID=A0A926HUI1_9FIRM|nr:stage II sporulation protein M [Feifania hominis]MBC8535581.1 stage II sporulation protein M [Feifania hominis]
MKKSGSSTISCYIQSRWPVLVLGLLVFLVGLFAGTILYYNLDAVRRDLLNQTISTTYLVKQGTDFFSLFCRIFVNDGRYLLLLLLSSVTLFGLVTTPLITGFFGFTISFAITLIYLSSETGYLAVIFASFAPKLVFLAPAIILLTGEAVVFGKKMIELLFAKDTKGQSPFLANIILLLCVAACALGFCALSALVETALSMLFLVR